VASHAAHTGCAAQCKVGCASVWSVDRPSRWMRSTWLLHTYTTCLPKVHATLQRGWAVAGAQGPAAALMQVYMHAAYQGRLDGSPCGFGAVRGCVVRTHQCYQ
jgi:hypothetical protein